MLHKAPYSDSLIKKSNYYIVFIPLPFLLDENYSFTFLFYLPKEM